MDLISAEYRKQNELLHQASPAYGKGGDKHAHEVMALSLRYGTRDILDYGCGKGRLARSLQLPIKEYDPAISDKSSLPDPADLIICTDVLEHVELDRLYAVLDHIRALMKIAGLLIIATRLSGKFLPDGRNAHLIIQHPIWWKHQLMRRRFKIVEMCALHDDAVKFIVEPV